MTIFADYDVSKRAVIELPDPRFGWEDVQMTEEELQALNDYADAGMINEAVAVVDGAYGRMFGESIQ